MPAIQSLGVGSGLDANAIISQLLAIERQPLQRLQAAATGIQSEISAFGTVKSKLDALDTAAATLASASTWTASTAQSADSTAMTVTALDTADPVSLDIQVSTLAKAQSVSTAAGAFASSTTAIGASQTLSIEVGEWIGGNLSDPTPVNVSLDATDTLADVRDKINAASAGLTATILNDSIGARLVIRSSSTGAENAFKISSTEAGSPFSFTATATFDQTATDLEATVNGASIRSDSNTLTNLVDGVTISVLKTTTSAIAVSVEKDLESIKTKLNTFVATYNDLIAYLRQQTSYNEATKTAAPLQGDRLAVGLQGQIRSAVMDSTAASGVFGRLSGVGIQLQRDGSLSVNTAKLDSSLQNLEEVAELFSRDDASATSDGIAVRLSDLIDSLTDSDGALSGKTEALRSRLERNQDDQDRMNDRLALVEARLQSQYTALDRQMASLNGLNQYVSQQMQMISNAGNKR